MVEDGCRNAARSGGFATLSNVFLHYVFDLWVECGDQFATGDVIVVRYADDCAPGCVLAR